MAGPQWRCCPSLDLAPTGGRAAMALGLAPTGGGAAMALPVLSGPATPSAMSMLSRRISCGSGGSSSLRFRVVIAVRSYTIEIAKINLIKRSRTIHGQSQQTNQLKEQDKSSVPVPVTVPYFHLV